MYDCMDYTDIDEMLRELEIENMMKEPDCNDLTGDHCYQCPKLVCQSGYNGRKNLVCGKTGELVFEE